MTYQKQLQRLLAPLGVYDLSETSLSGASLYALGDALDALSGEITLGLQNAFPGTADAMGCGVWEQLLPPHPIPDTLEGRRSANCALAQKHSYRGTKADLEQLLSQCGFSATVTQSGNTLTVTGCNAAPFLQSLLPLGQSL